jgi:hypothetical protein
MFSGSVGGYEFINLTVISNVTGGALAFVTASNTGVTHTSGSGDLTVDFGAYNFTLPAGPSLFLSASGTANWTISQPGDSESLQGSARADNLPIIPGGNSTTILPPLNSFSASASAAAGEGPQVPFLRLTTPFVATGHAVIHQAIGSNASYQSTIVVQ